ncbi:MAG: NAD(+)/NADH kinase [Actinomycetota bacterium]|nr:NAD(+)/NADH kinase [Actinomycetota bacterium]
MKKVALFLHATRAIAAQLGRSLATELSSHGIEVVALPEDAGRLGAPVVATPAAGLSGTELALVLGGDGTMLRAAALFHESGTALLGVNLGRLGFLTQLERDEVSGALEKILADGFEVEERMTLEGEVFTAGEVIERLWALNDIIVEKLSPGRMIKLGVAINSVPFTSFGADGLIVATPTGSTAYSFSAHGPVISPSLDCMVLTPVSAHMLFDRSIVVRPDETIEITVLPDPDAVSLILDGRKGIELAAGAMVRIRAGKTRVRLARVSEPPFWTLVRTKFGLKGSDD